MNSIRYNLINNLNKMGSVRRGVKRNYYEIKLRKTRVLTTRLTYSVKKTYNQIFIIELRWPEAKNTKMEITAACGNKCNSELIL